MGVYPLSQKDLFNTSKKAIYGIKNRIILKIAITIRNRKYIIYSSSRLFLYTAQIDIDRAVNYAKLNGFYRLRYSAQDNGIYIGSDEFNEVEILDYGFTTFGLTVSRYNYKGSEYANIYCKGRRGIYKRVKIDKFNQDEIY